MALADDINALPTTVGDGNSGHTGHHQTIHAALKSHETKLSKIQLSVVEDAAVGRRALVLPTGTVELGDTGWVDLRGSMLNGWTATTMMIRRIGGTTRIQFAGLDKTAATSTYFLQVPQRYGLRGNTNYMAFLSKPISLWASPRLQLSIQLTDAASTNVVSEIVIPAGHDNWPTALGGPLL